MLPSNPLSWQLITALISYNVVMSHAKCIGFCVRSDFETTVCNPLPDPSESPLPRAHPSLNHSERETTLGWPALPKRILTQPQWRWPHRKQTRSWRMFRRQEWLTESVISIVWTLASISALVRTTREQIHREEVFNCAVCIKKIIVCCWNDHWLKAFNVYVPKEQYNIKSKYYIHFWQFKTSGF